ncbi:hypothetical protein SISNIDRAFT_329318 [Sistotremastrum niveocremeum HHB9708]|uniref:Mediator of RNA polymerase II transcription subunit 7 n=1 Tax=Sistotremastrum niveocremeum HHB9708 TaxID=1314777 RepID=A0A164XEI0_9AGAM|nr:hypothetical protein SISNIDRAFT_329318 [Sistotremastrum niveocremeum HHB9708]
MDDAPVEVTTPFPSPPTQYSHYTTRHLSLLELLNARRAEAGPDDDVSQRKLLEEEDGVPDWPLESLEKPRVDWILEEGQYTVFGDTWFTTEHIPTLAEGGGTQLFPSDPSVDRRPALLSILRSLDLTYSFLLKSLLAPPIQADPEWIQHITWISTLSQNIMAAANELRPFQARANLESMMLSQLETRRKETRLIHEKCDALEAKLSGLRLSSSMASQLHSNFEKHSTSLTAVRDDPRNVSLEPLSSYTGYSTRIDS